MNSLPRFHNPRLRHSHFSLLFALLLAFLLAVSAGSPAQSQSGAPAPVSANALIPQAYIPYVNGKPVLGQYVLLGWNDLGMHCYNKDFSNLAVLPPYNTLWAQVIKRGDPPQIVTTGIRVQYAFPDNTYSVGKSNFWTYVAQLFGTSLPDNVGLKGKGLADVMDPQNGYFIAEGIPLTEYSDSDLVNRYPYQKAVLTAKDIATGATLATLTVVAPVSTEMHCEYCHAAGMDPGGSSPTVELNILALHDREEGTNLSNSRPVLCARCHSSNALGLPGVTGLPSLSRAMHTRHAEEVPSTLDGCYSCHPGPSTRCLRDVMSNNVVSLLDSTRYMNCIDCHGPLSTVAQNPNPWLNEPRCDGCHKPTATQQFNQDQALYRFSTGHGGVRCEACHDSTHAIAPSSQPNDSLKFFQLQGRPGYLTDCTVCHLTQPTGPGPHALN